MPNGKIKKRYSLPEKVIKHIFEGEVKESEPGKFAGFHSEVKKSKEGGDVKIVSIPGDENAKRTSGDKPYKARVQVKIGGSLKGPTAGTEKSFFPKKWTQEKIVLWIEQALTSPGDSARCSHKDWLENPRQIRTTGVRGQVLDTIRINKVVCTVLYEDAQIASIYPRLPYMIE